MTRTALVATLALGLLAAPLATEAQPATKVPRIGWLRNGGPGSSPWELEGIRQGLRDLGYVEGQTIVIEFRHADDKPERLPTLAAELVRLWPDVLMGSVAAVRAFQQVTTTIPIVWFYGNPVASGLVSSLARPGGQITGLSSIAEDLEPKRLELLKEAVPSLARVGFLDNPGTSPAALDAMRAAGRTLGLAVEVFRVERPDEYDATFTAMTRRRVQGVAVIGARPNI